MIGPSPYNADKYRMYQKAQKAGMTVKAYKAMLARQKETASPTIRSDFPETEPTAEEKQGPSGPLVPWDRGGSMLTSDQKTLLDQREGQNRAEITNQELERDLKQEVAPQFVDHKPTEYGEVTEQTPMEKGLAYAEEKLSQVPFLGKLVKSDEERQAERLKIDEEKERLSGERTTDVWGGKNYMPPSPDAEAEIPEGIAAGEQSDAQRDMENPIVKDFVEISKNAKSPDPNVKKEAEEARKEIKKAIPDKDERAMFKEQYGNYWVDPNSGYAVNLDNVEADSKRKSNWLIIQQVPAHQRSRMMANLGFIDPEDVENLPDDPRVASAQITADSLLARTRILADTDLTKVDKQTAAQLGITTMQLKFQRENNTENRNLSRELDISSNDMKKLQLESNEWMFLKGNALKKYMSDRGYSLDEKKLKALEKNQESQINLGYAKIGSAHKLQEDMLAQRDKEFGKNFKLMSDKEKRVAVLQHHTIAMKTIEVAMANGQVDLASMTLGFPIDRAAYWKSNAKTSSMNNSFFTAAMGQQFPGQKESKVLDMYGKEKLKIHAKYRDTKVDDAGLTVLDRWITNDQSGGRGKPWNQMSPTEQEAAGGWAKWHATKMSEAVHDGLRNSSFGDLPDGTPGIHSSLTNQNIKITSGGGGDDEKKTPPEKGDETTETKVEPPAIVKTQEQVPGRVPKEIPAVKPGGQTVETTTKNFEDKLRTLTNKAVARRKRNPGYGAKVPDLIKRGKGKLKKIFGTRDVNDFDSKNNSESKLLKMFKENPEKIDEMDDAVQMYIYNKLLNK